MSKAIFNFVTLDTRKGATQLHADTWARTLGIEVTSEPLAALCRLGNVDPQHGHCRLSYDGANLGMPTEEDIARLSLNWRDYVGAYGSWLGPEAACNVAAIGGVYPSVGATLATVRPDCDSVLAMAVLVLRYLRLVNADVDGGGTDERFGFIDGGPRQARLRLVAERDSFRPGEGWAPRPLPTTANLWPAASDMAPASETQSLAPLGVVCSPTSAQRQMPLAYRVAIAACWLLYGEPVFGPEYRGSRREEWGWPDADDGAIEEIVAACGCVADLDGDRYTSGIEVSDYRQTDEAVLAGAYAAAQTTAHRGRAALAAAVDSGEVTVAVHTTDSGRTIAVVESGHVGALGLGYCRAPIVVAMMPARADGHVKATIAAWNPGRVDMEGLTEDLDRAEIGGRMAAGRGDLADAVVDKSDAWGGPATVKGSPQGHGTYIALADMVRLVAARVL